MVGSGQVISGRGAWSGAPRQTSPPRAGPDSAAVASPRRRPQLINPGFRHLKTAKYLRHSFGVVLLRCCATLSRHRDQSQAR
jgi:hypothetical protein